MTDRSKLLALAEAVEKLTGPDREVDAEIAACLRVGTEHPWALNYPAWIATPNGRVHLEKHGPSFASPTYTASLDAAMTLVIKDRDWMVDNFDGPASGRRHSATVFHERGKPYDEYSGYGANPALALCAAALRAQAEALA